MPISDFQASWTYDGNGNIQSLTRNGHSNINLTMDDMAYEYYPGTNRLKQVEDQIATTTGYTEDFEDMKLLNYDYVYDEIGNLSQDLSEEIDEIKWNAYGKVTHILRSSSSTKPDIEFTYDASGNRASKTVKNGLSPDTWKTTYYVRDALGNLLATYTGEMDEDPTNPRNYTKRYKLDEQYLYGSTRLGLHKAELEILSEDFNGGLGLDIWNHRGVLTGQSIAPLPAGMGWQKRGNVRYEISDYLGNVRSVISDRKIPAQHTSFIDYSSDIVFSQDYYPFGMSMPNRKYTNTAFANIGYRYGFHGQEADNEVVGSGSSYSTFYRQYDSGLGIWKSINPEAAQMPFESPYSNCFNNPQVFLDGDGDHPLIIIFLIALCLMNPSPVNAPSTDMEANKRAMMKAYQYQNGVIVGGIATILGGHFLFQGVGYLYGFAVTNPIVMMEIANETKAQTWGLILDEEYPNPVAVGDNLSRLVRANARACGY